MSVRIAQILRIFWRGQTIYGRTHAPGNSISDPADYVRTRSTIKKCARKQTSQQQTGQQEYQLSAIILHGSTQLGGSFTIQRNPAWPREGTGYHNWAAIIVTRASAAAPKLQGSRSKNTSGSWCISPRIAMRQIQVIQKPVIGASAQSH